MNKLREKATVEAFLRFAGQSNAVLVEWDRERPDAVIRVGSDLVGVEITTLSEAVPRQLTAPRKWQAEARRIVESAREAFESTHSATLVVRFEMHPAWTPPTRAQAGRLVRELAGLVHAVLDEPSLSVPSPRPVTRRDPHPAVEWLYVGTTSPELGGHWQPSWSHSVVPASPDDVRHTVARKETEIDVYLQAAPRTWLLIDCDVTGQGIALDVPRPDFAVSTRFDRVFSCGFGMWQWIEIPTNRLAG